MAQWCADNGHALARTAYVGNESGWVSVVNLNPYSRAGGVRVRTARGIAVDLRTHVVFVANEESNAVKVITP